ncbi:MAG: type II secretion system protein [Patescibacteria group bacterium]
MIKQRNSLTGFTLIELLVAISVIGFLITVSMVIFKQVRMSARDAVRVENIATIKKALAMYFNDSTTGYTLSSGECLSSTSTAGSVLKTANVIVNVPVDPMWATTSPFPNVENGFATGTANFCYYYYSTSTAQYKISYYLETNSKFGNAGINRTTQ